MEEALGSWWGNRVKKVCAYDYIWFVWEFVYKDDILMWEALIWKRVAVDKKTIISHSTDPCNTVPLEPLSNEPNTAVPRHRHKSCPLGQAGSLQELSLSLNYRWCFAVTCSTAPHNRVRPRLGALSLSARHTHQSWIEETWGLCKYETKGIW